MRLGLFALLIATPLAAQQPARKTPTTLPSAPALPGDTAVHTGKLANGLRYWIRHNSYPEHRLELRLVVRAGSILEDNDQRGLAHFIEHMGFNGTTHFAKNDLVKYLESIGVKYGADLNANTGFDETQYILPVPSDKPELVARAFDILQDWAMGDKFDPAEVATERGVITGEWRSGLGVGSRERDKEFPILFQGSKYAIRLPIGDTGIIAHATAAPMKRFYHDWYRPDLMAVIAVGDFPIDSLERLIKNRFGGMKNPVPARPRTEAPIPTIPGTRVAIITDPEETTESVQLLIRRPSVHYRTEADERRTLINALLGSIAGSRMSELARKPDAPFVAAGFGSSGFIRDLQLFQVNVSAKAGKSAAAFEAALRELRRFGEHGVLAPELERAKASLLRGRESAAAEIGKTESYVFLGSYIGAFVNGNAVVSAQARYSLAQTILPAITIDEVNTAIREASRGNDRFIAVVAPDNARPTLPARDTLLAILARTDTMTLPAWVETTVNTALVPNPPRPGRIVSETTYADIGVTDWRLSNGVRVLIKPTDFKADEVQIAGESAGGASLAPDDAVIEAALAPFIVQQSGVGDFDAPSLRKRLAGKIVGVRAKIDETSQGLNGRASPRDLETAFQLLWLNATAPRLDTVAVAALKNQFHAMLQQRDASPESAFSDTVTITMGRNSPRAQPLTAARIDKLDPERALGLYREWFRDFGEATFLIVGNTSLDSLRPLVTQWLGGLPAAGAKHAWRDVEPRPPEGAITKVVRKGKAPVATQVILFTGTTDPAGPETELIAAAAAQILQERLLDKLREAMGATYGVDASMSISRVPRKSYSTAIDFKSSPQQADTLWQAAQVIIAAFRNDGPTKDELQKFVEQTRRETEIAVKTNGWWLGQLSNYTMADGPRFGRSMSELLEWNKRLDALTPAMVQDAARRYLDPANVARFVLLPEN